jgi:hypothetical protein
MVILEHTYQMLFIARRLCNNNTIYISYTKIKQNFKRNQTKEEKNKSTQQHNETIQHKINQK